MIRRLSTRLSVLARGSVALAGLLVFIAFAAFVLPPQDARMADYASTAGVPDLSFHYSAADLHHMAETYGPEGREFYIKTRFTFDALWPLIYAVFLVAALGWAGRLAGIDGASWPRLANLAPIVAAALDYGENLIVAWVVARHPEESGLAAIAGLFTMGKWVFLVGSFVALAVTAGFAIRQRVTGRFTKEETSG